MSGSRQRWVEGDVLRILEGGVAALWSVVERAGRGWRLKPCIGGDTRTLSDQAITAMRQCIERYRANPQDLPPERAELLQRVFEAHPERHRTEALRRAEYVTRVALLRTAKIVADEAFELAANAVWAEKEPEWRSEDAAVEAVLAHARAQRARIDPAELKRPHRPRPLAKPTAAAVESWYHLWLRAGKDIRVLIPLWGRRGDRRPRFDAPVYQEMKEGIERDFLIKRRPNLSSALRPINKALKRSGYATISLKCLRNYLFKHYSDREETRARFGPRIAHLRHDVFKRLPDPDHPLDMVEIDHSLLDVIVVDEESGRPLGRPWLTLLIDVKTRMILGLHLSFEVPSYASVQRCLAHAFWPKDLSGLGLRNAWPTEGIAKVVKCDNGREFRSRSLRASELSLGFTVVYCPARQPWMKGRVERIFGTIGIRVLDLDEGKTFSNVLKRGEYKSVAAAKTTLSKLKADLLRYIVDDYHVSYHEGLKGIPLEEWNRTADLDGVDGVPSYDEIRRLTGSAFRRPISNIGIRLFGFVYSSEELSELRGRRGGSRERFDIRVDPFNIHEIEVLDRETGKWLVVPSDRPKLTLGVSIYQARMRRRRALRMSPDRQVTPERLDEAARLEDVEAAKALGDGDATTTAARQARYGLDNGAFFTPLAGAPAPANDPGSPAVPARALADVRTTPPDQAVSEARAEATAAADDAVRAEMLRLMGSYTRSVA